MFYLNWIENRFNFSIQNMKSCVRACRVVNSPLPWNDYKILPQIGDPWQFLPGLFLSFIEFNVYIHSASWYWIFELFLICGLHIVHVLLATRNRNVNKIKITNMVPLLQSKCKFKKSSWFWIEYCVSHTALLSFK